MNTKLQSDEQFTEIREHGEDIFFITHQRVYKLVGDKLRPLEIKVDPLEISTKEE